MSDPLPNIEGLCRLCLSKGDNKSVFDREESNQQTFIIKIQDCVSIKIIKDNELPAAVCKDCEDFVNSWYIFKEKCDKAQLVLKKWFGSRLPPNNEVNKANETIEGAGTGNRENIDDELKVAGSNNNDGAYNKGDNKVSHIENNVGEEKSKATDDEDQSLLTDKTNINELQIGKESETTTASKSSDNDNDERTNQQDHSNDGNGKTDIANNDEICILDENVTSTVTSSSNNKETPDNQSSCHAIKIASAVSLPKGFFERNFDDINGKDDDSNKQIEQTNLNVNEQRQTNTNNELNVRNSGKDGTDISGNDVIDINGSSENIAPDAEIASSEPTVPDSTMTSPKEQEANIMRMVTSIKTEPVDEQELSESTVGEIRVKTEPEELVEEHVQNPEEEIDLTSNKCTICNYVFSSNNSLMRHLSSRKHIRRSLPPDAVKVETPRVEEESEILPDNSVRSTRQKSKAYNNFDSAYNDDSQETYLDDSFFCKICNRTYCSSSELKRHNRSMKHMRNLSIRAALKRKANKQLAQEQQFGTTSTFSLFNVPPRVSSHLQKDYICPMENCNFACKEGSTLLEHMVVHGIRNNANEPPERPMLASSSIFRESYAQSLQKIYCKCKQVFTNNSEYLYHLKLCRFVTKVPPPNMPSPMYEPPAPPQQQPKKQVCRLCDITFTSQEVYLNHLQIYHKGSTLEQAVPKVKASHHSGKLWTQFVNKAGEILYNCIICHKKFKQHFSLNSHLRQHKQPPMRRDVCKICNKVFSNSKFFEKHVRGHFLPPNSRKLFCFKCYKTFDHRGEIIAHRATCNSMKMKIYSCSVCKHSFKDLATLKEHKIRAHTSILPVQALCTVDIKEESVPIRTPIISENKTCHICNKSFYNYQNMKRHCLTVHKGEDLSFLEYGPFTAYDEPTTSSSLPQPSVTESQIDQDKWDCEFCKKQFRSEKLLIYHIEHHCPYLQHIPNIKSEKPVERTHYHKNRCVVCARFLPAYQGNSETVCARCIAKFEGTPLDEQGNRKSGGSSAKNSYHAGKTVTLPTSSTLQNSQRANEDPQQPQQQQQQQQQQQPPQLQVTNKPLTQPPSPKGNFFQCPIGKKLFTTEAWMMKHYKNCDGSCPSYINCARCNLNFKSASMYEKHVPKCEAGTIKRFDCSLCGKTYSKRDYVVKHKRYAHRRQIDRRGNDLIGVDDYDYDQWIEPITVESTSSRKRAQQLILQQQLQQQQQQHQHQQQQQQQQHQQQPVDIEEQQLKEEPQEDDDVQELPDLPEVSIEIVPSDDSIVISNEDGPKVGEEDMKTFPCDGCARVFTSYKGLANHSVVHSRNSANKSQYDCKFCNRGDLQQSQIYSHTYRCIKFLLSQEPVVSCKHCQRNFNTSQQTKEFSANVISHVFDCYDIPYYKNEDDGGRNPKLLCYICCYAFSCPDKLRFHKAEHARKSQAKSYSKKAKRKIRPDMLDGGLLDSYPEAPDFSFDLQPPRKIIRTAKLYKCRVCNRKFFSINKLKNHEKVHGIIQKNVYSEEQPTTPPTS